ncbi:MAG: hypothetical protein SCALA702_29080 [Melioribacteraceae bacterium]|nr:MAG: hypothetical protein SCALA702_29080 [Melioribacteraceae bacterium]
MAFISVFSPSSFFGAQEAKSINAANKTAKRFNFILFSCFIVGYVESAKVIEIFKIIQAK